MNPVGESSEREGGAFPHLDLAILGAGTMGAFLADLALRAGHRVCLHDPDSQAMEVAQAKLANWERETPKAVSVETPPGRLRVVASLGEAVRDADIVLEAAPESLELKREIFARLDALCPPAVILASNSSSLRMSRIETGVKHRKRVANMHFFQPPARPVEIMGGTETSPTTFERLAAFGRSLRLRPFVLQRESTGFLYNRIWRALKREVLREFAEGVASPEEIDRIVMLMWGWPKGPFAWMDAVGLDVVRDIENVYFAESDDPRDKPPMFLDEMIARGEVGVKSGKGFYTYPEPAFERKGWLEEGAADPGATGEPVSPGARREDFVGAWRLASFEATPAKGANSGDEPLFPFGEEARGCLYYTPDGRMSVMLSRADRPALGSEDMSRANREKKAAALESCLAYFGTFKIESNTVIHRIEHCTLPDWVGTEQKRFFRFEGDRLLLTTPPLPMDGRAMVSTLVWERMES